MEKFLWKQQVSFRLTPDDVELANEVTPESFPEFGEETTNRVAFLAVLNKAVSNVKKSSPADVQRIQFLENDSINQQNEIGKLKIKLDFKEQEIESAKGIITAYENRLEIMKEQSENEIKIVRGTLPTSDQIVVSLTPFLLALVDLATERLTVKLKTKVTPEQLMKELMFSYFKEESELNIPYVIRNSDLVSLKKIHIPPVKR